MIYCHYNKGQQMCLVLLILILILIGFYIAGSALAHGHSQRSERERVLEELREAKRRAAREEAEARKQQFPYGTDIMGKIISDLDRDSRDGLQTFLSRVPEEKTYGTMTLKGRTYDTVTWTTRSENRVKEEDLPDA